MSVQTCCTIVQPAGPLLRDRWTSVARRVATPDDLKRGEPLPCAPCRGTGNVISNLGGTPQQVTCPWCEGGGVQLPEHDAQAARSAAST